MGNRQSAFLTLSLHRHAGEQAKRYVDDFATALIFQSKLLAYEQGAEEVLRNHVDAARGVIRKAQEAWVKELVSPFGGALLGASVHGLITELNLKNGSGLWFIIWAFCLLIGGLVVFWDILGWKYSN